MKGRHARGGRVFVLATLVFTLGMLQGGLVHAQGAEGRTYIQVTDANGAPVTDLDAKDFIIKQGDVEVKILRIELLNQPCDWRSSSMTPRARVPISDTCATGCRRL